jgi:Integrase core domain
MFATGFYDPPTWGKRVVRELNDLIAEHGKLTQNTLIESFNGRMREELLNEILFMSFDHARL